MDSFAFDKRVQSNRDVWFIALSRKHSNWQDSNIHIGCRIMNTLKLVAVGDIALSSKEDKYPFRNIQHLFTDKDLNFGNLEVVLSERGIPAKKRAVLRANPRYVNYLLRIGFNIVNIANNHIFDYGMNGYYDTLSILEKNKIKYVGHVKNEKSTPVYYEKNGLRIGFLAYMNPEGKLERIIQDILSIKETADIVIVSFHWGVEYTFYPMPWQQKMARTLIDCGADVILGHHPHVVQGVEKYSKGLIIYSLGNFQFDLRIGNMYLFKGANIGLLVELVFSLKKEGLVNYRVIPIKIDNNYEPNELTGKEKTTFLRFLDIISMQIKENQISESQWFELSADVYMRSSIEAWIFRVRKFGISTLIQFFFWLIQPFTIKMIIGLVKSKIRFKK